MRLEAGPGPEDRPVKVWHKESTAVLERSEADAPAPAPPEPRAERDRLLLLIPEGSLAFRLHTFPDIASAQEFVADVAELMPTAHWGAFWTHDSPPVSRDGTPIRAEVVVILRDETRPEVVQLSSFVDMEGAVAYLRVAAVHGLDMRSVIIFWVTPITLKVPPISPARKAAQETAAVAPVPSARPAETYSAIGAAHQPRVAVAAVAVAQTDAPAQGAPPAAEEVRPSQLARAWAELRTWPGWRGLAERVTRAALLKRDTIEEVREDPYATGRARVVVAAGVVSAGIGAAVAGGVLTGIERLVAMCIGWLVCLFTIQVVGRQLFGWSGDTRARLPQAIGLASGPTLLFILGAVPVYGPLFVLAGFGWLFASYTIATYVTLELDMESTILTAGTGWLLFFAFAIVLPALLF